MLPLTARSRSVRAAPAEAYLSTAHAVASSAWVCGCVSHVYTHIIRAKRCLVFFCSFSLQLMLL